MADSSISPVSVVIPNYNHNRFLPDAIESVLNQDIPAHEIIVVDDGSTDDCSGVVAAFGNQIRYIRQENQGLAGARNTGIRAASGEYVGLLDADDQWLPDYLTTMVAMAQRNPNASVYYCQARCTTEQGGHLPRILGGPVIEPTAMYETLLRANFLIPSTILMRRQVILDAGLFDPTLRSCEDWDLWLRLLPEHHFVGSPRVLVLYRQHNMSLSKDPEGMLNAARTVIEKHFGQDDGRPSGWQTDKKRAFGGLYRYFTLTYMRNVSQWNAGATYLRHGLRTDPTLANDEALFYELAMGSQPAGYRETAHDLNLEQNAGRMQEMLTILFDSKHDADLKTLKRTTLGTAYFALGLLAYNTGNFPICRQALATALYYRPDLWREPRASRTLIRALAGQKLRSAGRRYWRRLPTHLSTYEG